jgi:YugN-like family
MFDMIEIPSRLEGKTFQLYKLEEQLKPLGYTIGGNWDYDHGYFDYKIDDEDGYQFLRIPFKAVDGQLDSHGTTVEIGRPFLLSHQYQSGLDDHADGGNLGAAFNQFSEPEDPDAAFPEKYISVGKVLVQELERRLLD